MPANRFNGFTTYGIGIGLRAPHYDHILTRKPVCDWFEIISENYMIDGGRPLHILDQILEQYKVVQHGVSMYFGSAEKPNREHLRRLKTLVRRTKTPWVSDHLCWGSVDGRYTHDLLPMPYTFEAARLTAQKIREVRDFLEVPVVVENVSKHWTTAESEVRAVDGVSFSLDEGTLNVLLGPSGCGKSTTLRLIAGLEPPDAGRVFIDGREVTHLPPAQRSVAMVFQSYALFPHLSVGENIVFGLRVRKIVAAERERRLRRLHHRCQQSPYVSRPSTTPSP